MGYFRVFQGGKGNHGIALVNRGIVNSNQGIAVEVTVG